MKISKTDTVMGGRLRVPRDRYRVRVTGTDYGKSASGNPMTTLSCEIIAPETIEDNGNVLTIAGKQFKLFLVHNPNLVGKQTQSSQSSVFEAMEKLGVDVGEEYDTELHKQYFLGLEFDMILDSEEDVKRYPRKEGEKVGAPILDGAGEQISNGWQIRANVSDILPNCAPSRVDMPD